MRASNVPLRLFPGLYILNAGLTKVQEANDRAEQLHAFAKGAFPQVRSMPPERFVRILGTAEMALGGALLAPFVPARLAGLVLTGFAGGLMWLYWKTPGMHEEGSPRPTQQGTAIAKDSWILGIGLALLLSGSHGSRRDSED
jgi:hypothetical protein